MVEDKWLEAGEKTPLNKPNLLMMDDVVQGRILQAYGQQSSTTFSIVNGILDELMSTFYDRSSNIMLTLPTALLSGLVTEDELKSLEAIAHSPLNKTWQGNNWMSDQIRRSSEKAGIDSVNYAGLFLTNLLIAFNRDAEQIASNPFVLQGSYSKAGSGGCFDFATAFTSLARMNGIPARVTYAVRRDYGKPDEVKLKAHGLVEIYDLETDTWHTLDPKWTKYHANTPKGEANRKHFLDYGKMIEYLEEEKGVQEEFFIEKGLPFVRDQATGLFAVLSSVKRFEGDEPILDQGQRAYIPVTLTVADYIPDAAHSIDFGQGLISQGEAEAFSDKLRRAPYGFSDNGLVGRDFADLGILDVRHEKVLRAAFTAFYKKALKE